jgi:putative peptidoglycan lipid II flippase
LPGSVKNNYKKIKDILSKEQTEILEAAFLLMLPSLLTKITGLIFNLLAASYFGTDDPGWNQFIIASAIPEMLANILLIGAIGSVIIPILLACKKEEGKEKFLRVYSSIVNISIIAFSLLSLILIIFADSLFPFLLRTVIRPIDAPSDNEVVLIIQMMRVLLIPQLILGFSVFISSGLNVYNRLLVPQLAPLFYNIGRIVAIFTLLPLMDYSPWALVIGVFVGSILHLLVQIPLFRAVGLQYKLVIDVKNKYLKEIGLMGFPRMLALASEHIAFTVDKFFAFGVNGAAALTYANSLSLVVPTLFGYTFSVASFPTLSELYIEKDYKQIKYIVNKSLNQILFLALPFTVTLLVLRVPIVRLVFGLLPNTSLDLEGTYQIAWIILWFSLGWVFVSGKWFMYRLFYAVKDTFIPLVISGVSLVLTIVLSILFINLFSHNTLYAISDTKISLENLFLRSTGEAAVGGVALGMSVAYSIEFFLLLIIFNYKKISLDLKNLWYQSLKKFIAGIVMFVTMYFMYKTWNVISYSVPTTVQNSYTGSTTINLAILTGLTVVTSFLVYYLVSLLLKIEEIKILKRYLNPIFRLGGIEIK